MSTNESAPAEPGSSSGNGGGLGSSDPSALGLAIYVSTLVTALEECLEYFEARYDVVDGEHGPLPNAEMALGQMIETALGRRP